MTETICIPKKDYEQLVKYKHIAEAKKNNQFKFEEVFGIGTGKLKAQEVKNMLREEW